MEVWKDVKGYEGLYMVSNYGNVKRIHNDPSKNEVTLKKVLQSTGYYTVGLSVGGKTKIKSIHRLVAESFIPNPLQKPQVNHKDGVKTNNNVENLEWCTPSENALHAWKTGLSKSTERHKKSARNIGLQTCKPIICTTTGETFKSINEAGRKLGIASQNIWKVLNKKRNSAGGLKFEYCTKEMKD